MEHKIKQNEQTTNVGQRKPNNTRMGNSTITHPKLKNKPRRTKQNNEKANAKPIQNKRQSAIARSSNRSSRHRNKTSKRRQHRKQRKPH